MNSRLAAMAIPTLLGLAILFVGCKSPKKAETSPAAKVSAAQPLVEAPPMEEPSQVIFPEEVDDRAREAPQIDPRLTPEAWLAAAASAAWSGVRDGARSLVRAESVEANLGESAREESVKVGQGSPAVEPASVAKSSVDAAVAVKAAEEDAFPDAKLRASQEESPKEVAEDLTEERERRAVEERARAMAVRYGAGRGFTGTGAGESGYTGVGAGQGFTGYGAGTSGFTGTGAGQGFTGTGGQALPGGSGMTAREWQKYPPNVMFVSPMYYFPVMYVPIVVPSN